jgi:uncharacterized protein
MEEHVGNIIEKLDRLLNRVEGVLDAFIPPPEPDNSIFDRFIAFRWEKQGHSGRVMPVEHPHLIDLDDLLGVDHAKGELVRNTRQFAAGRPANNVLLWGERGNGKSSCIKGLLKMFAPVGVRLIEVQRWDLLSLPAIINRLRGIPFRFILFCDDLSFSEGEVDYRALKTLLEGGIEARPDNILIYATSNRRHLIPEPMTDNTGTEEIHPEEAVSEKLSLSDRFGLTLGFSRFDQETYLAIVKNYARQMNIPLKNEKLRREAILWTLYNGSRSGRAARQFVDDLSGRLEEVDR